MFYLFRIYELMNLSLLFINRYCYYWKVFLETGYLTEQNCAAIMTTDLTRLWATMSKNVSKYGIKYPLFGQSYEWIMGAQLENARNLINQNEAQMRNLRETAYSLQDTIHAKELKCREINDSLRNLKKTDPSYKTASDSEIELLKEIESLQIDLTNNKHSEQLIFESLQQSIRDYHQMDNEYKERLKRISYSWSIVWIVFSVGIGTIFAYRFRKKFLNDLKLSQSQQSMTKTDPNQDIQKLIDNTIEKQYKMNNNEEVLSYLNELEQRSEVISEQLNIIIDQNSESEEVNALQEKYVWLMGGLVSSVIAHGFLLWLNGSK